MTINILMSSIIQVLLFSIIPFVWWLISGRKDDTFLNWLGLKRFSIKNKLNYSLLFLAIIVILMIPSLVITTFLLDESTMATSQFSGGGISVLFAAIIYAFLQTGFSEELFFRGFLAKRLIHKLGFQWGNIIQGSLFGLMHGVLFISTSGLLGLVVIVLITGITGYLLGWINEKYSNGSIISSWLIHGTVNLIPAILAMFNVI